MDRAADEAQARHKQIADAAYYLAMNRGFAPGGELEDWLAAERKFDRASHGEA